MSLRISALALVAVLLAATHIRHRPGTLCLFRAVTGLPCPFCGGTTAVVRLGHGDIRGALAASPLGVAMVSFWPVMDVFNRPGWWSHKSLRLTAIGAILIASEVFELFRFHVL